MTRTLLLEGEPAARGEAHGEQARDLIVEAAQRWRHDVGEHWADHLAALVDHGGFQATARARTPWLVEELEGVARASGVDVRTVWALNLLDEDWWTRAANIRAEACSGFGVQPGPAQDAVIGQNMDLPSWLDGLQVLLDVRPSRGPRVLAPSYAGMVATNALNEHGIGVCVNTLDQLPTDAHGLPVAFVIRLMADQRSFADAVAVVNSVPHASGQNYIVGSPDGVADLECGAGGVRDVTGTSPWLAHTNHPIGAAAVDGTSGGHVTNSEQRLDAIRQHLENSVGPIGVADAAAFLREPPLCRGTGGDRGFTFYSVVMTLAGQPALHLTAGPPSRHDYVTHRFG
ncbi:MAG TPA: C45 family peptidase [Acidimicrobiales bacterium]|nr:C45 family peptidase [Acidimicrobiales bacterium]